MHAPSRAVENHAERIASKCSPNDWQWVDADLSSSEFGRWRSPHGPAASKRLMSMHYERASQSTENSATGALPRFFHRLVERNLSPGGGAVADVQCASTGL